MAKAISKSQKIRNLLADGLDVAAVAKKVGVSANYVYAIRWQDKNKKAKAKAAKQAKKVEVKVEATPLVLTPPVEATKPVENGVDVFKLIETMDMSFHLGSALNQIVDASRGGLDYTGKLEKAITHLQREIQSLAF